MTTAKTSREVDTAFNVLLKELEVEYSQLEPETVEKIVTAIERSPKVKNAAINYLYCPSTRAEVMRDRLRAFVLEMYKEIS